MTAHSNELPYALRGLSLNARQEAFCEFYDDDPNAAAAARNAGYSARSARSQGSKLLADSNIQQHIATLKKIRARARALDRELLLERLEELYHACMAEGRLNAAIQALRLMAQIAGHTGRAAQKEYGEKNGEEYAEEYGETELEDARPFGPLQRAARQPHHRVGSEPGRADPEAVDTEELLRNARLTLARTRPEDGLRKTPLRAQLFMGTAPLRPGSLKRNGEVRDRDNRNGGNRKGDNRSGEGAGGPSFDTPPFRRHSG